MTVSQQLTCWYQGFRVTFWTQVQCSDGICGFCSRPGESPNTWKHFGQELTQE